MKSARFIKIVVIILFVFSNLSLLYAQQQPIVKVDLNITGRQDAEVLQTGYTSWDISKINPLIVDGVTFTVAKGPRGTSLSSTWFKTSVIDGFNDAKLTNDGLFVKDGDFALGSSIILTIKGLPAGEHKLVTYHNIPDGLLPAAVCPIDVYVNGVLKIDNLIPTIRLEKVNDIQASDLEFTVADGEDVVITYAAETSGSQAVKNVYINGFQLNGVNTGKKSRTPIPTDRDEHVDAPNGTSMLLKWSSSPSALSHDIYYGTDSVAVANADHNSSCYKGNQAVADTSYQVNNLYSMNKYYWRIDEVSALDTYKGDIWRFRTRQLAFPEAEGYGRFARGGRGGKVVEVTTLADSGPGSLREAVTNNIGPRTIVFAVSGIIQLNSRLVLSNPYVTVAGQTAPGKGICIRSAPFGITGNDCIVRNMRVRLGGGPTYDGMGLTGANNSILDHCSISWTIDESFSSRSGKNITLQRTLISEALNAAGHQNYPAGTQHGYAATIGGDIGSFHHNLLAHNYGRNWSLGGGLDGSGYYSGRMDITNNVVYNWGSRATDGGTKELNFVNNYYKPGAGTTFFYALSIDHENTGMGMQRGYFSGNVMPGRFDENTQTTGRRETYTNGDFKKYEGYVDTPFFPSYVTTQTAYNAYKMVLSDVGCNQPVFDDHDVRIVNETLNGTYTYTGSVTGKKGFPDNQADVGGYENYPELYRSTNWDTDHDGMPDWWENLKGFNSNSAPGDFTESNGDPLNNGVTNLENYLNWMATPHYSSVSSTPIVIDLKKLSIGYKSSPVFSVSNTTNGSISLSNGVATFTPQADGLGSFDFTVTDSEGGTMTRKVNTLSGIDITLPIILTTFEATRKNVSSVVLKWKTSQEINNNYFIVERSFKGGSDFEKTGSIIPSKAIGGNSKQELSYEMTDANSYSGNTYYRLNQIDKDGKNTYSDIKVVKGNNAPELKVWPIPSNGDFSISVNNITSYCKLKIYDVVGNLVKSFEMENGSTKSINIDHPGVYILKVFNKESSDVIFTEKVIIN